MSVATKQRDIITGRVLLMHPTLASRYASLFRDQNSVIPTLFSLNLALKSTRTITEKCFRCRSCCQWSAALLKMCLFCGKVMRSCHGWGCCALRHAFVNSHMWPANITDYHIFRRCLSEIQGAMQYNNLKLTTFGENDITQIRWKSSVFHKLVRWHFRCGGQMHDHLCQISSGFCLQKILKSDLDDRL